MTQTHTPTPYRINDNDKRQVITGDRTGIIATCQSRENAAFIVKACNRDHAFDVLVEALEKATMLLSMIRNVPDTDQFVEENALKISMCVTDGENALALAEGK